MPWGRASAAFGIRDSEGGIDLLVVHVPAGSCFRAECQGFAGAFSAAGFSTSGPNTSFFGSVEVAAVLSFFIALLDLEKSAKDMINKLPLNWK